MPIPQQIFKIMYKDGTNQRQPQNEKSKLL